MNKKGTEIDNFLCVLDLASKTGTRLFLVISLHLKNINQNIKFQAIKQAYSFYVINEP